MKDHAVHLLAEMAGKHCQTTWAFVSFVDMGRLWFQSVWNADDDAVNPNLTLPISRQDAFCAHTILQNDIFEVRDTYRRPISQQSLGASEAGRALLRGCTAGEPGRRQDWCLLHHG
jgi:hypothetical protein